MRSSTNPKSVRFCEKEWDKLLSGGQEEAQNGQKYSNNTGQVRSSQPSSVATSSTHSNVQGDNLNPNHHHPPIKLTEFEQMKLAAEAEAGKASVCEGCPGQAYCQSQGGVDPDQEGIDLRMGAIKHKILVLSGKGGVGKSTVACLLAGALASKSQKVGVVDLDICGPSIPKLLDVEGKPIVNSQYGWKPLVSPHYNIKVMSVGSLLASDTNSVVFRGPRKSGLIKRFIKDTYWGRLDFLICDTPPGTSDEHLTVIRILKNVKPDGAIIVTTPQAVALTTIRKEINFCKKMGVRVLGLVGNMESYICPCCGESSELFPSEGLDNLAAEFNIPIIGRLPLDQEVTKSCEVGNNVIADLQTSPIIIKMLNMAENIRTVVDDLT